MNIDEINITKVNEDSWELQVGFEVDTHVMSDEDIMKLLLRASIDLSDYFVLESEQALRLAGA